MPSLRTSFGAFETDVVCIWGRVARRTKVVFRYVGFQEHSSIGVASSISEKSTWIDAKKWSGGFVVRRARSKWTLLNRNFVLGETGCLKGWSNFMLPPRKNSMTYENDDLWRFAVSRLVVALLVTTVRQS